MNTANDKIERTAAFKSHVQHNAKIYHPKIPMIDIQMAFERGFIAGQKYEEIQQKKARMIEILLESELLTGEMK